MGHVVKTFKPADGERRIIPANASDYDAIEAYVTLYGQSTRKDAVFLFNRDGGLEVRAIDPAGKFLGWVGWWYPTAVPEGTINEKGEPM